MRAIDDLIDNYKSENKEISESEKLRFNADIEKWLAMLFGRGESSEFQTGLIETVEHFRIPYWPLEAFARSMYYDVNNDGFAMNPVVKVLTSASFIRGVMGVLTKAIKK